MPSNRPAFNPSRVKNAEGLRSMSGLLHFVKNTLLRVVFSSPFSVFRYFDETRPLLFGILHLGQANKRLIQLEVKDFLILFL